MVLDMLNAHFPDTPAVLVELKTLWDDILVVSWEELQKTPCNSLLWVNKCIAYEGGHLTDTFKI
jgi:hypothetical protein